VKEAIRPLLAQLLFSVKCEVFSAKGSSRKTDCSRRLPSYSAKKGLPQLTLKTKVPEGDSGKPRGLKNNHRI